MSNSYYVSLCSSFSTPGGENALLLPVIPVPLRYLIEGHAYLQSDSYLFLVVPDWAVNEVLHQLLYLLWFLAKSLSHMPLISIFLLHS